MKIYIECIGDILGCKKVFYCIVDIKDRYWYLRRDGSLDTTMRLANVSIKEEYKNYGYCKTKRELIRVIKTRFKDIKQVGPNEFITNQSM